MVARRLLAGLALAALTRTASAITPAALHALVRAQVTAGYVRARSVQPGNLAALLPPGPERSLRPGPAMDAAGPARVWPRRTAPAVLGPAPASAAAVRPAIYSDAVMPDRRHPFGIRLGTWMRAQLPTRISSADPGLVELRLSRTVHGARRQLPAGTLLFCAQRLSDTARRLELTALKGITPGGFEFRLRGRVFDTTRIPGLSGIVTVDTVRLLRGSVGAGVLAAGGTAVGGLLGQSGAAAAAAGAAGGSLLNTAGRVIAPATRWRRSIIYVAPQPVLIRVSAEF